MTLAERRKRNVGLTRPELAVLLAYAKLALYNVLLESNVPDDPYLGHELERYFPKEMSERYDEALHAHRLRREIIATQLTNSMINRGGATLIARITDQTGASAAAIAAAFAAVRNSYGLVELNGEIDALDNKLSGEVQLSLYAAVQDLLLDRLVWFLRNVDLSQGLDAIIGHYRDGIAQVEAALTTALSKAAAAARDAQRGGAGQAPACRETLALRLANLGVLKAAPDIVSGGRPFGQAGGRGGGDLFRHRELLPARPRHPCGERHRGGGLFRSAGARPRARFDRRCRAAAHRGHGRQRRGRRRRGGGMGQAAPPGSRAHPRRDPRDRRLRADAVEAVGGGEFAGGFGEGVVALTLPLVGRVGAQGAPGWG